jgi:hypothetical protein
LVVVVEVAADGFVVVVDVAADGFVVVVTGTVVVVVVGAVVVVVTGAVVPSMACRRATSVADGTLGSVAVDGPKATVINCRLRSLRSAGFEDVCPPTSLVSLPLFCAAVDSVQERTRTTPVLPASGVPVAHFCPFLYNTFAPGYCTLELDNFIPVYPEANLPKVACVPASLLDFGAMSRTPLPVVVKPVDDPDGVAASVGWTVPQMSMARPACHVCPTVGATALGVLA